MLLATLNQAESERGRTSLKHFQALQAPPVALPFCVSVLWLHQPPTRRSMRRSHHSTREVLADPLGSQQDR